MGKIFVGQTKLDINLFLRQPLPSVTTALIKYTKPDDSAGSFTATVVDETDNDGQIQYEVTSASDIDQAGAWIFWAHITYSNGKIIQGECSAVTVYTAGDC